MFFSARASHSELAQLLRRLGHGLHAGLEIRRLCEREAHSGSAAMKQRFAIVSTHVNAGEGMAAALKCCGDYFPPLVYDMAEVGEHTGKLDEVALRLADHYDHLVKLRRNFLLGIAWPAIQLALAVVIVGLLIWAMGIVGHMAGAKPIDVLGLGLTGTRGLFIYIAGVITLAAGAGLGLFLVGRSPLLIRVAVRLPVLGRCLENMALSRLCWCLALAHEAGMDARRTVTTALRATNHPPYSERREIIDRTIAQGGELHEGFRNTGVYPHEFLDALENAEHAGRLTEALMHLSGEYKQRAQAASVALTVLATVGIWMLVAGVIIAIIFKLALFYVGTITDAANGKF